MKLKKCTLVFRSALGTLDVLHGGLGKKILDFFYLKKNLNFLSIVNFLNFFVMKSLDSDPEPDLDLEGSGFGRI